MPTYTFNGTVKGAWLTPFRNGEALRLEQVYINGDSIDYTTPVSSETFEAWTRESKIVSLGRSHGAEGQVSGKLLEATGYEFVLATGKVVPTVLDATEWAARFKNLVRSQGTYDRIELTAAKHYFRNVLLTEGYRLSEQPTKTLQYSVDFDFIELL